MKICLKLVIALGIAGLICILLPTNLASAYSYATAVPELSLVVTPDDLTTSGIIYFYNVDSNETTHVAMEVVSAPDDWIVTFTPALHEQVYTVGDNDVTAEENLAVELTEVESEPITVVPEGYASLTLPNKIAPDVPGYCLAKQLDVVITAPASVSVGETYTIIVEGNAFWFQQDGSADISTTREFEFTVSLQAPDEPSEITTGGGCRSSAAAASTADVASSFGLLGFLSVTGVFAHKRRNKRK